MGRLKINWSEYLTKKPTPLQLEALSWQPPKGTQLATLSVLSPVYGTSKTTTACLAVARFLLSDNCSWHTAYGHRRSTFIVTAPESRTLKGVIEPELGSVIPPELIRKRSKDMNISCWELVNGCVVYFLSGRANLDSYSVVGFYADECSHPYYSDEGRWAKLCGRVRDTTVPDRYKMIVASGIADELMKERFFKPTDPTYKCLLLGCSTIRTLMMLIFNLL